MSEPVAERLHPLAAQDRRRRCAAHIRLGLAAGARPDAHDVEVDVLERRRPLADLDDRRRRHRRAHGPRPGVTVAGSSAATDEAPPGRRRARRRPATAPATAARRLVGRRARGGRHARGPRRAAERRPASRRAAGRRARRRSGRTAGPPRRGCGWRARSSGRRGAGPRSPRGRRTRPPGPAPAVGSSRNTTAGSWSSARAIASFCFMPLLNVPAGRRAAPRARTGAASARCARRGWPASARTAARRSRGSSRADSLSYSPGVSVRMPIRRRISSGSSRTSKPSTAPCPRSAR